MELPIHVQQRILLDDAIVLSNAGYGLSFVHSYYVSFGDHRSVLFLQAFETFRATFTGGCSSSLSDVEVEKDGSNVDEPEE